MHKSFLVAAAVFGGLAVALGAFGAHGLQRITADEKIIQGFQTGVQYQLGHALALLAAALLYERLPAFWIRWTGYCFIAGIFCFSGSLYLLTLLKIQESNAVRFVGPVTPLGGLLFIGGWFCLLVAALKYNR